MEIKNHRLYQNGTQVPYQLSPNRKTSRPSYDFLIVHYTAGRNAESSVNWLTNPNSKASAHLIIGRDGSITQLVPFNQIAWHAGESSWNGISGINKHSIGIELDNAGKMQAHGDFWLSWFGKLYPSEEVIEAKHRNEEEKAGWHLFTEEQLTVAKEVAALIVNKYNIREVLGHDDISPYRKVDPGPAFPMLSFRSKVLGRKEDTPLIYKTTVDLNIRVGPGAQYSKLSETPLPQNTRVDILRINGSWRFVDVLDNLDENLGLQGWVHGRYLAKVI
ncbi:MAG: N-acetylmuramoyl-L-alanine amidase [Bacteroidota bacterium]